LLGADIRNPQLHRYTKKSDKGLTDFQISDDQSIDSYIHPFDGNKNLDVVFSGSLAPNPTDLLDMKKFGDLMEELKHKYDYIVMDSAPVMLVSDTLHLLPYADVVLYVTKSGFTEKDMLSYSIDFAKMNHVKHLVYILNGVKDEYSEYRKQYGKGYNYYNTSDKDENFFKKVYHRLFHS